MQVSFTFRSVVGKPPTPPVMEKSSFGLEDVSPLIDLIRRVSLEGPFIFSNITITLPFVVNFSRINSVIDWVKAEIEPPQSVSVVESLVIEEEGLGPYRPALRNVQHTQIVNPFWGLGASQDEEDIILEGDVEDFTELIVPEQFIESLAELCTFLAIAPVGIKYRSVSIHPEPFESLSKQAVPALYILKSISPRPGDVIAVGKRGVSTLYVASPPYGLLQVSQVGGAHLIIVDITDFECETDILKRRDTRKSACTLL